MGRFTPLGNRTGPTFGVKRPRRPQWNRPPEINEKKRKFSKQLAPSGSIHATRESNWTHIWRETHEKVAVEQTTRTSPKWVDHATRESNWTHIWRETPEKAAVEQTTRNQMKKTEIFETASPKWVDPRHSAIELDSHLA
ncbi:hypothetical protein KIN20_037398 [Parelaphostrongylus tenuis]|uniref:Uncharacterized protein n=1 Tax=Parelaphostrongylus tenuis TaxID=148309 RepID=A0AAD5RE78_PARTN|nr:hypothetical protein KIN20_037398 [Parelaphostrongylus tenuis]